jgi:hypothetical protein
MTVVHQFDEQLAEPRRGVDVDLTLDVDNLDTVPGVMVKLQIHKSSSAMQPSSVGLCLSHQWSSGPVAHSTTL